MKKILTAILACAMVLSMAACGNKDEVTSSSTPSSSTESSETAGESSETSEESSSESSDATGESSDEAPVEEISAEEIAHYEAETAKVEEAIKEGLKKDGDDKLKNVHEAVIAALNGIVADDGNYLPTKAIEKEELTEVYGINADDIDAFIAEASEMSTHVDTFIAVKAKEGKGEDVEKALTAYRETLVKDTMQYPMNVAKINASKVIRDGDYVFFSLLGSFYTAE